LEGRKRQKDPKAKTVKCGRVAENWDKSVKTEHYFREPGKKEKKTKKAKKYKKG